MRQEEEFHVDWRDPASGEDKRLACVWLPGIASAQTIVMCHGFGSGKRNRMFNFIRKVVEAESMGLVAFDFEGHYESGGERGDLTLGRGVSQLGTVVDHLVGEKSVTRMIAMGSSFGGTVALLHQFARPVFQKVILRSPISNYVEVRLAQLGEEGVRNWAKQGTTEIDGIATRYDFMSDAMNHIVYDHIRPLASPVYIIHGTADKNVSVDQSIGLTSKLKCPTILWAIRGAGHDYSEASHQAVLESFLKWSLLDRSLS